MLETQDLKDFSISFWYQTFKACTLQTVIIDLPGELLRKFRSDASDLEIEQLCSADYLNQLRNAIRSFTGSEAFVKNNWHAPIDAKFISFGNSLKVTNVNDLFLYLTASDIISSDFEYDKFDEYCIALRPWINIHPASEFRCIVINNVLRGITPRDWPTYYAHFKEDGPTIINALTQFYSENIKEKFPRKNYIFDVIISYPEEVILMDFSPLNSKSNLYAFAWKEIHSIIKRNSTDEVAPVFRYLENDMGIMTKSEALFKISQSQET